jgi:hypothetical protein
MTTITVPRAVLEQALEALEMAAELQEDQQIDFKKYGLRRDKDICVKYKAAITALRDALAQQEPEPVAWTDRELELIDGMIEVQLHHAAQCDGITNRPMAERQKGWDMERVALLRKIKSISPRREPEQEQEPEPAAWVDEASIAWLAEHPRGIITTRLVKQKSPERQMAMYAEPPRREWQSLSEEEINELSHTMVKGHKSVNWLARAIEAALKEKNNG